MGCKMTQPVIPAFPIGAAQIVSENGDSLTKGWQVPPGTNNPAYAYLLPFEATVNSRFDLAGQTRPTFINNAVSGQTSAAMLTLVNTQIIASSPDHVLLQIGTNDLGGNITAQAVGSNVKQIIAATLAVLPACKFHIVSIPWGEYWPNGADPNDVRKTDINTAMQDAANAFSNSAEWIDIRPGVLAWEAANNPTHLTQGLLTQDGFHPTKTGDRPAGQSGAEVWSSLVYNQIQLTVPK